MAKEIERRFLVASSRLPKLKKGKLTVQGYFDRGDPSVRVRLQGNKAFLTIKSSISALTRDEFEFKIPFREGEKILQLTKGKVEKERFYLNLDKRWSIDFFKKENSPLVLAEIELKNEGENFEKPLWIEKEVTNDRRFFSLSLAFNPYKNFSN